jgi:hypothetical protein
VDYKKIVHKAAEKDLGPFKVGFNDTLSIAMDPNNKTCAYRLTAKYVTKQSPYIDSTIAQSADGLLVRKGAGPEGDHCRVNIIAKTP